MTTLTPQAKAQRIKRWRASMIKKYGSLELWQTEHSKWVSKGGKNSTGAFKDKKLAKKAGHLGGVAKARKGD